MIAWQYLKNKIKTKLVDWCEISGEEVIHEVLQMETKVGGEEKKFK